MVFGGVVVRSPGPTRFTVVVATLVLVLSIFAGCGGEQQGDDGSRGNAVVVGYGQEPQILNPLVSGGESLATSDITAGILEAPLQVRPDLSYEPRLTDGMPEVVSEKPFTVEYRLKKGLTWSDGEPLTSADARFTYEQIVDPGNLIIAREGWDKVEKFETPDKRKVRITFSEPYAAWRDLLSGSYPILPEHVYEGKDFNDALNDRIVGSGPFELKEWNKGRGIILEKNDNYWGEEPKLDEISIRFLTNNDSLVSALESGQVDFINPQPDLGSRERLEGMEGVRVESKTGTRWEQLAFNVEKVSNPKLREAVAYGIDRQEIVDEMLQERASPLQSVVVPELGDYYVPAWKEYGFDPDRARRLAEEAKAEGADTTITFSTTSGDESREALQQTIRKQLEDVGLKVEIENAPPETFFGTRAASGDFEMGEWAWFTTPDPSVRALFSADRTPPDGQNYYRYQSEEVTKKMAEADATVDETRRAELTKQVQKQIAEDLPLIPLYQQPVLYAYDENLSGPEVNPTPAGPFWNIVEWSLEQP